jgi:hypothetical protein
MFVLLGGGRIVDGVGATYFSVAATVGLGRGDGVGDRLIILCFVEQWLTRAADRTAKFGVRDGELKPEISWDVDESIRFEKEDLAGAI